MESEQIHVPGQKLAFSPQKTPPQLHQCPETFSQIPPFQGAADMAGSVLIAVEARWFY